MLNLDSNWEIYWEKSHNEKQKGILDYLLFEYAKGNIGLFTFRISASTKLIKFWKRESK